jgi:hypothetical protein
MAIVAIPFQDKFEPLILNGSKICTSRTKRYGQVGDIFRVGGKWFSLMLIEELALQFIADKLYKAEGLGSPADFISVWRSLPHYKGFQPEQKVFVHFFTPKVN